ncbi:MAG: InlB B-repeat-containing protein [Kiritimatiellae bacterium]|nr:InlB B-repeat-containing protein [Kiritimatiellia bacterium]
MGGCPVTALGENAFSSCAALTSVELPSSITHIGSNVFYMCETLNSVRLLGNEPAVCENIFTGTPTTLTTYVMPETLGWDGTPTSSLLPALWPAGTSGRNISTYGVNCTVTFIPQEGIVDPASKTVTSGSLYGELPAATRTGYTFSGWWTTTNATSTQITPSSYVSPSTNHSLYAKWLANNYTVFFVSSSGLVSPSSMNVTYGSQYGALPNPTWSGYTLLGWSPEQTNSDNIVVPTSIVATASNHNLYAVWTNKAFTVTLNAQGGSVAPSSFTVYYNMPYGELPEPARADYVFDGWWTGVNGTETKITTSSLYLSLSNKTLYAKWLSQYSITFDSQGGVVSPTTKTVTRYQPYGALPEPSFADAIFLNWWTQPNARGQIVTCDSNVISSAAHTLYAQWDINSVVESSDLPWTTDGTAFWFPQTKTVKNSLLGMRSGTISHNQSTWIEATVNGPCRLRYWWNISSETSYDYLCCTTNNEEQARISGFNMDNPQQSIGWTQQTLELPAGANTVRWTYTKDFADKSGYDTAWLDSVTLARGISVIFDPQGGSCVTTQKMVYVYELYDDLPFPVKAGNQFSGWWLDADGSGTEVTTNTVVNGKISHTLYAKWIPLATTSTPVPVPFSWLDLYFPLEVENHEAKAYQIGANGLPIWGSYLAGLIPTNANSLFIAHINLSNDTTYVTWEPNLGSERIYCIEGKTNLTDASWSPTNEASRFFRVKVSLP